MSMDAMMSAIPVGSTLSITKTSEDSKEHILFTLQIAVKQVSLLRYLIYFETK